MSNEELNEGRYYTYDPSRYQHTGRSPIPTVDPNGSIYQEPGAGEPEQEFDPGARLNFKFFNWQNKVIEDLYDGDDVYVIAPPGAGKTLPVTYYWLKKYIFGIDNNHSDIVNTSKLPQQVYTYRGNLVTTTGLESVVNTLISYPQTFKKLIYVVPIRALAQEVYSGFVKTFSQIFLYYRESSKKQPMNNFSDDNRIRFAAQRLVALKTGGQDIGDPDLAPVVIMTAGTLANEMPKISSKVGFIIFDEAHVYQPTDRSGARSQSSEINAAQDLNRILKATRETTQLAFLTGTIHPTSATLLMKYMNVLYHRKFKKKPFAAMDFKNMTPIEVVADDSLIDDRNIAQTVIDAIKHHEQNVAVILFSKNRIDQIVNVVKSRLGKKTPAELIHNPNIKKDNLGFFRNTNKKPETYKQTVERIMNIPGADKIKNKDLREAVSYGIGYVYRLDEGDVSGKDPIPESDKEIIKDLFQKGIIKVLLSTTAIGVGINFDIQKMYIPTLDKPESTPSGQRTTMPITDRELIQLLNRVGRGAFSKGMIYTTSNNTARVTAALNSGIEDFEKEIPAIVFEPKRLTVAGFVNNLNAVSIETGQMHNLHGYFQSLNNNYKKWNDTVGKLVWSKLPQWYRDKY